MGTAAWGGRGRVGKGHHGRARGSLGSLGEASHGSHARAGRGGVRDDTAVAAEGFVGDVVVACLDGEARGEDAEGEAGSGRCGLGSWGSWGSRGSRYDSASIATSATATATATTGASARGSERAPPSGANPHLRRGRGAGSRHGGGRNDRRRLLLLWWWRDGGRNDQRRLLLLWWWRDGGRNGQRRLLLLWRWRDEVALVHVGAHDELGEAGDRGTWRGAQGKGGEGRRKGAGGQEMSHAWTAKSGVRQTWRMQ